MSIIVTDHAVERYAERLLGIAPKSLTHRERDMVRDAITKAVPVGGDGLMNWTVRRRDATYIVKNRVVKTVLPPVAGNHGARARRRKPKTRALP